MKTLKPGRLFALMALIMGFILIYFPLLSLVFDSFLEREGMQSGGRVWTWMWYERLLSNHEVLAALKRSLLIAFWTTLIATTFGTLGALFLARKSFWGKRGVESFLYLPLVMPEIVLGLSLLVWFVFLGFPLGLCSVILAHVTFTLSYVIMTVQARLQTVDVSLEEAARDLGANAWRTFWEVTFPLIRPGIFSGALISFTLSFDDFLITFFTIGVQAETLPLKIYSMMKYGSTPEMSALSTLLLLATAVLVIFLKPRER